MSFISSTLLFLFIMDPFGNLSAFLFQLRNETPSSKAWIIFREMCLALGLMLLVYGAGDLLRCKLDLSQPSVYIATGMVLFLAALSILFPGTRSIREGFPEEPKPFFVPLATPLISGPCLLAMLLLYAQSSIPTFHVLSALLTAWLIATLILMTGEFWKRLLGRSGLIALERLIAMVLVMIAIQRFLDGVRLFIEMMHAGTLHA